MRTGGMRLQQVEDFHVPLVVSLLKDTMPWAPCTETDITERQRICPDGQRVVTDSNGRVIGYGFLLKVRAGRLAGTWYEDTGNGHGETHVQNGNVAYVGSTVWHAQTSIVVRTLVDWYHTQAEHWGVSQIMGFSRVPSLGQLPAAHMRAEDVHDIVLDGLDPLTRLYQRLGFCPALPKPSYSNLDVESQGYGMMMVGRA